MTEAVKIAEHYDQKNTSASYWKKKEEEGIVPHRTCDSMRNFVKTQIKFGAKPFIDHNMQNIRFSHFNKWVPTPKDDRSLDLTAAERDYINRAPPRLAELKSLMKVAQAFNNLSNSSAVGINFDGQMK